MNKKLLPIAALIISVPAINAYATNGEVKFTGEIVQSTCTVTSSDKNKEVSIGKYLSNSFDDVGAVSASKAFSISLDNCAKGDYTLRFDGKTVAGHPNLLSVSQASGVGIEILTNDEKPFSINQDADPSTPWVTLADENSKTTFNLKARYKSFLKEVTPGKADANASFTIEYK